MKKTLQKGALLLLPLIVLAGCGGKCLFKKSPAPVENLSGIVSPGEKMVKVTEGMTFDTAGSPCWYKGELLFTNNNFDPADKSKTFIMDKSGKITMILDKNAVTTSLKPTGKGTFYCCEMIGHRVVEMGRDGKIVRVIADKYNGIRLDGPNDLVADKKGGFYFTDARFSPGQELVQDKPGVYYVKPDGSISRVLDDIEFPNGIGLSPDCKTLYVANTRGAKTQGRYVLAYDVMPDGTVKNGRNFSEIQFIDSDKNNPEGFGGGDGLGVDSLGNVYVATTRGLDIQVFNATGKYLGNMRCPAITNNMCFGGADMKTLFISAKDGIYKIKLNVKGK